MINAKTLLSFIDYCNENELSTDDRINLFLKLANNSSYSSFADLSKIL